MNQKVTVQPFIYYIRKPASKLSVVAMQLEFTSFHKWKAILPQKTSQQYIEQAHVLLTYLFWAELLQKL